MQQRLVDTLKWQFWLWSSTVHRLRDHCCQYILTKRECKTSFLFSFNCTFFFLFEHITSSSSSFIVWTYHLFILSYFLFWTYNLFIISLTMISKSKNSETNLNDQITICWGKKIKAIFSIENKISYLIVDRQDGLVNGKTKANHRQRCCRRQYHLRFVAGVWSNDRRGRTKAGNSPDGNNG